MNLPKRVLYARQAPYPWDVRVEKVCVALQQHGCEVEIAARRGHGEPPHAEVGGMAIHRIGPATPRFVSIPVPGNPVWQSGLLARARAFRPDMLIARDLPMALFTANAARTARVPWVMDMAEHYPAGLRSWKKYKNNPVLHFAVDTLRIPDVIERRAVLRADGILVVCEEHRQRLVREYGISHERVEIVLNTPARARFADIPPRLHEPGRLRFGYHGMISLDRDLLTVIRGFDLAAAKDPRITLDIAGFGESVQDLQAEIERLPNRDRITMSGPFTHAQIDKLYTEIDFGVCCCEMSTFSENAIANKFFDYAACGRPFLFTAQLPMLNAMQRMHCGISYRGGDAADAARAILELSNSDYAALARNGREAVATEFNWETDVERMMAFLEKTMAAHARGDGPQLAPAT